MPDKPSLRSEDSRPSKPKPTSRRPGPDFRGSPGGGGAGAPAPFRIGPLSWLLLALLIVWNAWAFMPHESAQVPLPYSQFVQFEMDDFERAWDKIVLGAERRVVMSAKDRRVTAYHESGHAVVAWLTPAADPVRKVSIVPHGRALGVTEQLPQEERYNMSRGDLLAWLDVMLGGRTSEGLVIGEITTGAENDLVQATRLARRMITRWGMGTLGPVAFDAEDEQPFLGYHMGQNRDYSEATAARIDREVETLLAERQSVVLRLLSGARGQLDALVDTLLKEETLGEEQLARVLGPRTPAEAPSKAGSQPAARSSVG